MNREWKETSLISAQLANGTTSATTRYTGLSDTQLETIAYIDIVSSAFSVLGSVSIILISIRSKLLRDPEVLPIFLLAVADLLAALTLLVAVSLHVHSVNSIGYDVRLSKMCSGITAFTACFFMITFLLMVCYALDIFVRMRQSVRRPELFDDTRRRTSGIVYIGFTVSWLIPLIVTTLVLWFSGLTYSDAFNTLNPPGEAYCETCVPIFHDVSHQCSEMEDDTRVWQPFYKFLFLVPLCVTLACLLVLYVAIYVVFRRSQVFGGILDFRQRNAARRVRNKAICYLFVFAICWLPTLMLGFESSSPNFSMQSYFTLYAVQAVVCPLQGFLNSLVYGWGRQGFQHTVLNTRSVNSGSLSVTRPQSYGTIDM